MEKITSPKLNSGDHALLKLRPRTLDEFIGNRHVVDQLMVLIRASKTSGELPAHIIFTGPPGLGKTTLAYLVSKELGLGFYQALGSKLSKPEVIKLFSRFAEKSGILFLDEFGGVEKVSAILCKAMEEYMLPNILGVEKKIKPFTLIAATVDFGRIPQQLRDRFTYIFHLKPYSIQELATILELSARKMGVDLESKAAVEIASRSRGTPRIANRLLFRCKDFSEKLDVASVRKILRQIGIDEYGLDEWDRKYIEVLKRFDGGPVGLATIAGMLGETEETVEEVIEPFLLRMGLIAKTNKGRILV